jgi:diguanylate cyclase (GGDEF)-like protein
LTPAPYIQNDTREGSPAAQDLERQIEGVLSVLLSPHITAAQFSPILPKGLPHLRPIAVGRQEADKIATLCWSLRLPEVPEWQAALAARPAHTRPDLVETGPNGNFTASLVTSRTGARYGILALKFAAGAKQRDIHLEYGTRAALLIGQSIQQWLELRILELELADEMRRTRRMSQLAELDGLTRILNHHAFKLKCAERIGNAEQPFAMMMIDVDNFKSVNDVYGHQFGDSYLREVALAIVRALPNTAVVGRIGGDEFAALVPVPNQQSEPYLDRLMLGCACDVQRAAARLGKPNLGHVSIGCALESSVCPDVEKLLQGADAALYANKSSGKSSGAIFDPDSHENFSAMLIRPRFLKALRNNELRPFFQPVIDLATDRICGFEVLVRWIDPQRGVLAPEEFASILAAPELAEKLTRLLFEDALEQFARRPGYQSETLALNLGTVDLIKQEFVFDLQSQLNRYAVQWRQIVIEVTENTMLGAINGPVFQNLTEMRSRGAKVALDDFGTGYGGLAHLRNWPVDIIKLDRSYVEGITRGPRDAIFARALIEIARTLGLEVIAEGIEDIETANTLRELGCQMAQGYFYSPAAPLEEF